MPVNPRSLENLLTVARLESGVTSEVHRIRASATVQAWFRAMTAEERGALLAGVMADAPAGTGAGDYGLQLSEGPSRGPERPEGLSVEATAPEDPRKRQVKQADGLAQTGTEPALRLSKDLLSIVDSLKAGAIAEFDYRDKRWTVSGRGETYTVYKRDLDKLVSMGLLEQMNNRYRAK